MFNHIHYTRRSDKQDKDWQGNQYLENGRSGRKRILQQGDFDSWKSNGVCLACLSRPGKQATNLKLLLFWEKRSSTSEENWTAKLFLLVSTTGLVPDCGALGLSVFPGRKYLFIALTSANDWKLFFDLWSPISSLVQYDDKPRALLGGCST